MVAHVHIRGEGRTVLSPENARHFRRQASEGLTFRIHQVPGLFHVCRFFEIRHDRLSPLLATSKALIIVELSSLTLLVCRYFLFPVWSARHPDSDRCGVSIHPA